MEDDRLGRVDSGDIISRSRIELDEVSSNDEDDLPSPSVSSDEEHSPASSDKDNSHYISDADREWRESLQQLELLLTMVLIPYIGKYFGRRFAFWGWSKYMTWKYPVDVVITSPAAFKGAGVVGAAAL